PPTFQLVTRPARRWYETMPIVGLAGDATPPRVAPGRWPAARVPLRERGSVLGSFRGRTSWGPGLDVAATIDVVDRHCARTPRGDTRLSSQSALLSSDCGRTQSRALSQNSRLQFSHRKTRARTLRQWPPHRGQRRQVPAAAHSIGSVVSPGWSQVVVPSDGRGS